MEIDNIKDRIAIKRAVDGLVGLNIKSPYIPDEIKSEIVEVMKSAFGILGTPIYTDKYKREINLLKMT